MRRKRRDCFRTGKHLSERLLNVVVVRYNDADPIGSDYPIDCLFGVRDQQLDVEGRYGSSDPAVLRIGDSQCLVLGVRWFGEVTRLCVAYLFGGEDPFDSEVYAGKLYRRRVEQALVVTNSSSNKNTC